jgi:hypothetical protein
MAILRKSALLARCDECRLPFDPVWGGGCPSCGRLLCGVHLYGAGLKRLAAYLGTRKPCVRCRNQLSQPDGGAK